MADDSSYANRRKNGTGAIVYKAIYPREKGIGIYVGTVSLGTVIGTVILGLIAMVLAFSCWGVLIFAILFGFAYLFRVYITGKSVESPEMLWEQETSLRKYYYCLLLLFLQSIQE